MTALCIGRPPEWWETGDEGNRLALAICRNCPERTGTQCTAGMPDPHPVGVIRAAVAYHERGWVCPVCDVCGYPVDDRVDARRPKPGCRNCRVPKLRPWSRKAYFAARYRRQKYAKARAAA